MVSDCGQFDEEEVKQLRERLGLNETAAASQSTAFNVEAYGYGFQGSEQSSSAPSKQGKDVSLGEAGLPFEFGKRGAVKGKDRFQQRQHEHHKAEHHLASLIRQKVTGGGHDSSEEGPNKRQAVEAATDAASTEEAQAGKQDKEEEEVPSEQPATAAAAEPTEEEIAKMTPAQRKLFELKRRLNASRRQNQKSVAEEARRTFDPSYTKRQRYAEKLKEEVSASCWSLE